MPDGQDKPEQGLELERVYGCSPGLHNFLCTASETDLVYVVAAVGVVLDLKTGNHHLTVVII